MEYLQSNYLYIHVRLRPICAWAHIGTWGPGLLGCVCGWCRCKCLRPVQAHRDPEMFISFREYLSYASWTNSNYQPGTNSYSPQGPILIINQWQPPLIRHVGPFIWAQQVPFVSSWCFVTNGVQMKDGELSGPSKFTSCRYAPILFELTVIFPPKKTVFRPVDVLWFVGIVYFC